MTTIGFLVFVVGAAMIKYAVKGEIPGAIACGVVFIALIAVIVFKDESDE